MHPFAYQQNCTYNALLPNQAIGKHDQNRANKYLNNATKLYVASTAAVGVGAGGLLTRGLVLRYWPQMAGSLGTAGLWLSNPTNLQGLQNATGFVFSIISPDPNFTVNFPGVGDEFGKTMMLALKNRFGKYVQFVGEKGATFANASELNWAQRLLDEGNNVRMMKESTVDGTKSADFFVNNIKTKIKEISDVAVSAKMGDRIKERVEEAIKQAGSNGNIIIDVSQQKGAKRQLMENTIERLRGKAKDSYGYRIVGDNFELTGSVTPNK